MKVVKKRADMHLNSHPIIFLDLFVCVCVTFVFLSSFNNMEHIVNLLQ